MAAYTLNREAVRRSARTRASRRSRGSSRRACFPTTRHNKKERPEALLRSPSRCRFRPPLSLTLGFRLPPSRSASTYLRSVLDARWNLRARTGPRKRVANQKVRKLERLLRGDPSGFFELPRLEAQRTGSERGRPQVTSAVAHAGRLTPAPPPPEPAPDADQPGSKREQRQA